MIAVIPPKNSNRINPYSCDFVLYEDRHLIEYFFRKLKHYRRILSLLSFGYIGYFLESNRSFCKRNFSAFSNASFSFRVSLAS